MWRFIKNLFLIPDKKPTERELEESLIRRFSRDPLVQTGLHGIMAEADIQKQRTELFPKNLKQKLSVFFKDQFRFLKILFLIPDKPKKKAKIYWTQQDTDKLRKEVLNCKF
jgi:hypothetical protein